VEAVPAAVVQVAAPVAVHAIQTVPPINE